ncbi:MAG: DUF192 domain-containing protein [Patescibacteria group bacterium]|jgi:uncharacterized membrane protein (UPF0127 family)|nr:DUF192 domain-containing protein [Patescibacteria group bacterium]
MTYFKKKISFNFLSNKYWRLFFILLILLCLSLFFVDRTKIKSVKAANCFFEAELALSPAEQYQGLSGRPELKDREAMLFLFSEKKDRSFVMRNMNFPLDIIFINDNRVVNIYRNLAPEGASPSQSYHSGSPVDAVLEIKAGMSQACGLGLGSLVNW